MSYEIAPLGFYYEDFTVGQSWVSQSQVVGAKAIRDYAKAWDPLPIHINPTVATASPHGGLIASGEHTFLIMRRALLDLGLSSHTVRVAEQKELRFLAPVRPGDLLLIQAICTEKRNTEGATGGLITLRIEVTNQANIVIMSCIETQRVAKRPAS